MINKNKYFIIIHKSLNEAHNYNHNFFLSIIIAQKR